MAGSSRIRLRHIRCFVAVAQEGNLGRAARQLQLTQPAVSKTLVELEEILGHQLVERGRFGARLSAAGERFLGHATTLLGALAAAESALEQEPRVPPRVLRIAALPTVAPDLLPEIVQAFRRRLPGTTLVVHTAANPELVALVRAGQVDLAVGRMTEPATMLGVSFELLYVDPLAFCVRPGHALARRRGHALAELLEFPLVMPEAGTVPHHAALNHFLAHGLRLPEGRVETLSIPLAQQLVTTGDAIWIAPLGAVRHALDGGQLARLRLDVEAAEEPVGILTRAESKRSADAGHMIELIRVRARARPGPYPPLRRPRSTRRA